MIAETTSTRNVEFLVSYGLQLFTDYLPLFLSLILRPFCHIRTFQNFHLVKLKLPKQKYTFIIHTSKLQFEYSKQLGTKNQKQYLVISKLLLFRGRKSSFFKCVTTLCITLSYLEILTLGTTDQNFLHKNSNNSLKDF